MLPHRPTPTGRTLPRAAQPSGLTPGVDILTRRGALVLIAPHPDDETLGAGGVLQDAVSRGREVWVVFVTHGDAFPWGSHLRSCWRLGRARAQQMLAAARRREALQATARLGIPPERVVFLGFPDRGLHALASSHYTRPYHSAATGVNFVPYLDAYRPGAPYTGLEFVRQLRRLLSRVRPGTVLTPGPLDSHGDHRATTALVRRALAGRPGVARGPSLLYYLVHSGIEWPFPKGLFPGFSLTPPPAYGRVRALSHALSGPQVHAKRDAIRAYASQVSVMGWNLWSFLRRNELLIPAEAVVLEARFMVSGRVRR